MSSSPSPDWANATAPGQAPIINSIFDFSAEALGQLKVWFEQSGISLPINQIVGYKRELRRLDRSTSTVTVANTTTETSLYSYVVPAGTMANDSILRLNVKADLTKNVANESIIINVKFGGTTLFDVGAAFGAATDANPFLYLIRVEIANLGAANSQYSSADFMRTRYTTTAEYEKARATSSIDTSVEQTLEITAQWSTASASLSLSKRIVTLELV